MLQDTNRENDKNLIRELELKLSELKFQLEETKSLLKKEQEQQQFFQLVADFTFGWELWFESDGRIKYCSPSCYDLTGYTANQIMAAAQLADLLVYSADKEKFEKFLTDSLDQMLVNQSLEFRILTRTKQLRWFSANVRGVYNKEGRYLGIRASVHDITRLKQAMGHIQTISEKNQLDNRSKQRLKSELEIKERELVSFLLQLSQKNEVINLIARQLKEMNSGNGKNRKEKIIQLLQVIDNMPSTPIDWDIVEVQMKKLYPGFFDRLQLKHPHLTLKDKKLCASLRLGLSSKEIAGLNNMTPQSVEIARVRLRKKLKLSRETRLSKYLELI